MKGKKNNTFIKIVINNIKIFIKGSPRAHFEHLGVLPGAKLVAKLHARHDGNSEIIR